MKTTVETVTSADGTRIALERVGDGAPVVLIGGAYNDRSTMVALAATLAPDFTAITYDRRGRGDSGNNDRSFDINREFDDLAFAWVQRRQPFQRLIKGDQLCSSFRVQDSEVFEGHFLPPTALGASVITSVINQYVAHQLGSESEELSAVLPVQIILVHEAEIGFIDDSRSLQRVIRALPAHVVMCQPMQLLMDQGH